MAAGETEYAYDADGNLTSHKDRQGTTRYAYDAEGRLATVTLPNGASVSYGYGPFGERIWREEDGQRTHSPPQTATICCRNSTSASRLAPATSMPVWMRRWCARAEGRRQFLHQDATRTVIALSDEAGRIVARPSFDAFGNRRSERDAGFPLGFGARPLDPATGLYDMRARFYDPASGRFVSPDPLPGSIADPVSLAPYLYARANPLSFADPFGLAWEFFGDTSGRMRAANYVSQQGYRYDFPLLARQPAPMFLRPLPLDLALGNLTSRDLEHVASSYTFLKQDFPGEAEAYRQMSRQMMLDRLTGPPTAPSPLSRASSYVGGLVSSAANYLERGARRCYSAICPAAPTVVRAQDAASDSVGATARISAGAAAGGAAAAPGFWRKPLPQPFARQAASPRSARSA
ncbi:MAG: hypothetical protein MZV49_05735 [Rhodopseudomonas palustris]|nr:hypothetical protein [Rhodopseudomonas palustris]